MKIEFVLVLLILTSCGGSLSDEQRKKIREDMNQHKIVRISDAEITEAAFAYGRRFIKVLHKADSKTKIDSLARSSGMKIKWIVPGAENAGAIEKQIIDAYLESSINGGMEDNIQKIEPDSLLYTKPITEKLSDGSENVKGMWSIQFSKKQLILSMKK